MEFFIDAYIVVLVCTIIQSIFGVGILLFGTPTLLFFGYTYIEILEFTLLPSLFISILQVVRSKHIIDNKYLILKSTIPFLIIGITLMVYLSETLILVYFLGFMLILLSIVRNFNTIHNSAFVKSVKYNIFYLPLLSFVHGLTNLGGGFLVFLISCRYNSKDIITKNVAFIYAIFSFTQISYLCLTKSIFLNSDIILLSIASSFVYLTFGIKLFKLIPQKGFNIILNLILLLYGLSIFIQF